MAFLTSKEESKIAVVLYCDDALDNVSRETYEEYLKDLDESKLSVIPGKIPSKFILKRNLSYAQSCKIKNEQVKMSTKGEMTVQMSFVIEEVRLSLIGIDNPPNTDGTLEYKQDGEGGASREIMEKLIGAGVVDDLYTALMNSKKGNDSKKK